ncbi:formin-like protein 20 [Asterias rubens]|uniref:formin-like protein 20 n=1 Tax=Asterias rubens TaxID=7604 RepID=UPI001455421C|nr:formin-like protein 20 [Asterias rubens]
MQSSSKVSRRRGSAPADGKMASLNVESLKRKFQALNNTQDSIQTLSLWIIHHKNHYRNIIEMWMERVREVKPPMCLTLFYLANDIIQNSKRKGATVFLDCFAEVLEEAATFCREEAIRKNVLRIFKIWGERSVYSEEFCDKLQGATVAKKPTKPPKPRPDPKLLAEFNHEEVPEVIEQLARFEGEVELKFRQLGMFSVDVASTETIMQLKDRAGGKRFSQQFEDSAVKLEGYVASLTKEVELRRKLFDLLQKSEIFYEAQYGEAKIVANAYTNFGMRVASLKKRLEEHKLLLPDSYSPMPSPTMDAPSPGATPPRDPNLDTVEVEDMELSDEGEDRHRGTIVAAPSLSRSSRASRSAAMRSRNAASSSASSAPVISHISTITGAGSRNTFSQPTASYSPFSNQSPPGASYSPSADYDPIPTPPQNSTKNSTTDDGQEEYGSIKDRLLQVMHDAPKLPVQLFDSPKPISKSSSELPPVTIPSYAPNSDAFQQQVSPIITVPPAVPAPIPPQNTASEEYNPFEDPYTLQDEMLPQSSQPATINYYTPTQTKVMAPVPVVQQPPVPLDEDDLYDPEMVDYLLEMPLEQKKKPPQSSCIIPLAGGFQSSTISSDHSSASGNQNQISNAPTSKGSTEASLAKSKSNLQPSNSNKPGGTPLRDECSTPPTQEDSPMLKEAKSNPIEFLTKIITSSRQTTGSKAPSSSFLSSLSMLTQTVQSTAKTEQAPQTHSVNQQHSDIKQNHNNPSVPFAVGSLISSFQAEGAPPPPIRKTTPSTATVYQKSKKVPLCQLINTPSSNSAAAPVEPDESPPAISPTPSDDSASSHSLMARLMQHKTYTKPTFPAAPTPTSIYMNQVDAPQPPATSLASIILEPPPPPPLPPEKAEDVDGGIPPPPPEEQYHDVPPPPLAEEPPRRPSPPGGPPPPSGPPTPPVDLPPPPSGPPPLPPPPSGPPPRGPPPSPSGPHFPESGPSQPSRGLPPFQSGHPQPLPPPHPQMPVGHPHQFSIRPLIFSVNNTPATSAGPPILNSIPSPVPALSPTIRNTTLRMPVRIPPPPPGPPPPNAKRAGALGLRMPTPSDLPSPEVENCPSVSPLEPMPDNPVFALTAQQTSIPMSPVETVMRETEDLTPSNETEQHEQSLSYEDGDHQHVPQPTSPISVLGASSERSIPVLGQAPTAKDMWERPFSQRSPRSPAVSGRYNDFSSPHVEKFDYAHNRPIETLDRNRTPYQDRFPPNRSPTDVPAFRSSEPRYGGGGHERYPPPPRMESNRHETYQTDGDRGFGHRGRGYSHSSFERDYEVKPPGRPHLDPDYRSTQQLIEKELLSELGGTPQPRGAPISTLGGRLDRERHSGAYSPPRREEPQFWRGGSHKRPGPPQRGRPPPYYRY